MGLQITNTSGTNTSSKSGYIVVGPPPPVPDFTGSPQSGTVPLSVQFNDTSLFPGITAWNWSLGGGIWFNTTDSVLRNTTRTYTVAGTYPVALTVTNSSGTNTTSRAGFITANPVPTTTQAAGGNNAGTSTGGTSSSGSRRSDTIQMIQTGKVPSAEPQTSLSETNKAKSPSYFLTTTTMIILPPGLRAASADKRSFVMDRGTVEKAGYSVEILGDLVSTSRGGSTLVITSEDIQETPAGMITGSVKDVIFVIQSDPVQVGIGKIDITAQASLPSVPDKADVSITLSDLVPDQTLAGFRQATGREGYEIASIGYTATFRKDGVLITGPGMIRMSAPPGWVDSNGGIASIRIVRIGNDKLTEILSTSYTGSDPGENLNFEAPTPRGLPVFGLVAVQCRAGPCENMTQTNGLAGNVNSTGLPFVGRAITGYTPVVGVSLIIMAILIVVIRQRRRKYDWLFMR